MSPLIDRLLGNQKRLIERVTRDQSQLKSVREQLQLIVKENLPQGRHPDELAIAELERKIQETEKTVAAKQRAFVAPEELPVLLRQMLGRSRQIRLESLRLLPATPLTGAGSARFDARQAGRIASRQRGLPPRRRSDLERLVFRPAAVSGRARESSGPAPLGKGRIAGGTVPRGQAHLGRAHPQHAALFARDMRNSEKAYHCRVRMEVRNTENKIRRMRGVPLFRDRGRRAGTVACTVIGGSDAAVRGA